MTEIKVIPFKLRSREDFPCDCDMRVVAVEGDYVTYECRKCGADCTSSQG